MSDTSAGPGWWLASDGRWYPPELHPQRQAATQPPTAVAQPGAAVGQSAAAPQWSATGWAGDAPTATGPAASRRRWWYVGAAAAALVLVAVIGLVVTSGGGSLWSGTGQATVTWHSTPGSSPLGLLAAAQPFSGTIDGRALSGVARPPRNHSSSRLSSGPPAPIIVTLGDWTGTFDGQPFELLLRFPIGPLATAHFTVSGHYGRLPVTGTATPRSGRTIDFDVQVGPHHVVGTVRDPVRHGNTSTATATFTVS